ncbi:MAG: hypothetical protein PHS59_09340 [Paludibacter sp.]|nr:hypothetical protein [Paludibacter sp.]
MKKKNSGIIFITLLAIIFAGASCKSNDPVVPPAETSYSLKVKDVLGVSGTVTFIETSTNSVTIEIELTGASAGTHPAELCMNSAVEGGTVALVLNPVDETGKSSTLVTTMTYKELNAYDGFVQIHKSSTEQNVILANGDIGGNKITSTSKTYILSAVGTFNVSGTALFEKRVNGNTLVTITLSGAIAGQSYPASINIGSIASVGGGGITKNT